MNFTAKNYMKFLVLVLLLRLVWYLYDVFQKSVESNKGNFSLHENSFQNLYYDFKIHQCNISEAFNGNFVIMISQDYNEIGKLENLTIAIKLQDLFLNFKLHLKNFGSDLNFENLSQILGDQFLGAASIICLHLNHDEIGLDNYSKISLCFERSSHKIDKNCKIVKNIEFRDYLSVYLRKYCLKYCLSLEIDLQNINDKGLETFDNIYKGNCHKNSNSFDFRDFKRTKFAQCKKFPSSPNQTINIRWFDEQTDKIKLSLTDKLLKFQDMEFIKENYDFKNIVEKIENSADNTGENIEESADNIEENIEITADNFEENIEESANNIEEFPVKIDNFIEENDLESTGEKIEGFADNIEENIEEPPDSTDDFIKENIEKSSDNIDDSIEESSDNFEENIERYPDIFRYLISIKSYINLEDTKNEGYLSSIISEIKRFLVKKKFWKTFRNIIEDNDPLNDDNISFNGSNTYKSLITIERFKITNNDNQLTERDEISTSFLKKDIRFIFIRKQQQQQQQPKQQKQQQQPKQQQQQNKAEPTNLSLILKLGLPSDEELILAEYGNSYFESEDPVERYNDTVNKNLPEDILRLKAIKIICKRNRIAFPPSVAIRNEKKTWLSSVWITYYAHQTLYEWHTGEKEEWIFHKVESQIWPVLNHNISQLMFLTENGGWESVIGSFAIGNVSVYARFTSQHEYADKFCRIYIHHRQDWKYSNIYLSYRRLERDYFEIETKLDSFDAILTFRSECSQGKKESLNCFAEVSEQDIWSAFSHNHLQANASITIVPFPLTWNSELTLKDAYLQDVKKPLWNISISFQDILKTSEVQNFINLITWQGNFINFFSTGEETDQELYINEEDISTSN